MKKVLVCLLGLLLVVGVTVSLSQYAWAKEGAKAGTAAVKAPEKGPTATAPGTAGTAAVKAPAKPGADVVPAPAKPGTAAVKAPEKAAPATAPGTAGTAGEKAPEKK